MLPQGANFATERGGAVRAPMAQDDMGSPQGTPKPCLPHSCDAKVSCRSFVRKTASHSCVASALTCKNLIWPGICRRWMFPLQSRHARRSGIKRTTCRLRLLLASLAHRWSRKCLCRARILSSRPHSARVSLPTRYFAAKLTICRSLDLSGLSPSHQEERGLV